MAVLFCISCKERVTQQQLIKDALEIKLAQWQASQVQSCRDKVLVEAEKYVDSVLVAISLPTKLDTIPKPEKPVRPDKPPFKQKPDSVVVDPIYKKGNK